MLTPLDFLYIALSVMIISLTIPLSLILWRVFGMMNRVERILNFVDRIVGYATELEKIPMMIISKLMGK